MSGAPLPNTLPWRGTQLKRRDDFTVTFILTEIIIFVIPRIWSHLIIFWYKYVTSYCGCKFCHRAINYSCK
jgi:hypothetical protein